jgi:hypothetical protein
MNPSRRTNGARVDTLDPADESASDDAPAASSAPDLEGDVRPALSPAQLAFLALIAALIVTAIRRLRRKPA